MGSLRRLFPAGFMVKSLEPGPAPSVKSSSVLESCFTFPVVELLLLLGEAAS